MQGLVKWFRLMRQDGIVVEVNDVRWIYERLPAAGRGYRYVRELPTP